MQAAAVTRPLTPEHSDAFESVMGPNGACYGCWWTYFLLPPKQRAAMSAGDKHDLMMARIAAGTPPGLLLWIGDAPAGWMQIGPRAQVPQWNNPRRSSTPLPDGPVTARARRVARRHPLRRRSRHVRTPADGG